MFAVQFVKRYGSVIRCKDMFSPVVIGIFARSYNDRNEGAAISEASDVKPFRTLLVTREASCDRLCMSYVNMCTKHHNIVWGCDTVDIVEYG